jgi:hypothetical protein
MFSKNKRDGFGNELLAENQKEVKTKIMQKTPTGIRILYTDEDYAVSYRERGEELSYDPCKFSLHYLLFALGVSSHICTYTGH